MRDVFLYFFVFFVARPFGPDGDFGPPTLLLGFGPADGFGPDDGFGPLGLGPAEGFGPAGAAKSVGGVDDGIVGWTFMISDSGSWGLYFRNDARTYHRFARVRKMANGADA